MSNSSIRFAWEGDQSEVWADFYTDADRSTALEFAADATVRWYVVTQDGSALVTSFNGQRDASLTNRLTGRITAGAPDAGTYRLYAEVTQDGYTNTYPGNGAPPLILSIGADPIPGGGGTTPAPSDARFIGFIDYNHAGAPFTIDAGVWTELPNDGAGEFTNFTYAPQGVTQLMDTATGEIDPRELQLGDVVLIRLDYEVTPTVNSAFLDLRYRVGAGPYYLTEPQGQLVSGAGRAYRFALKTDLIYMGNPDSRDNKIGIEIRCSVDATVDNAGAVITVLRR